MEWSEATTEIVLRDYEDSVKVYSTLSDAGKMPVKYSPSVRVYEKISLGQCFSPEDEEWGSRDVMIGIIGQGVKHGAWNMKVFMGFSGPSTRKYAKLAKLLRESYGIIYNEYHSFQGNSYSDWGKILYRALRAAHNVFQGAELGGREKNITGSITDQFRMDKIIGERTVNEYESGKFSLTPEEINGRI